MGKEFKVGLAVLGVLLGTFGVVLYNKLFRPHPAPVAMAPADAATHPLPIGERGQYGNSGVINASNLVPVDGSGEDNGRPRDRFATRASANESELEAPPRSFMPDAADVSTGPREPDADSNTRDALAPPEARFGEPAAISPGDPVAAGNDDGDQPQSVDPNQAPLQSPDGADSPVQPDSGSPGERGTPTGWSLPERRGGDVSRGQSDADDPAMDPRARFAPGAYAGPHGGGAPTSAEAGKYVVQPNDNYWSISEKVYGTGGYFKAIHELNRVTHPRADRLQVGDVLAVPPASELHKKYPDLCPKPSHVRAAANTTQMVSATPRHRQGAEIYVVEQGDTLFDIARHKLGKASRWAEIYDLNRQTLGEDFDYLRPGTELIMPSGDRKGGDSLTRQRDGNLQR